jgi:uncharacterized protein (TIGR02646 family)
MRRVDLATIQNDVTWNQQAATAQAAVDAGAPVNIYGDVWRSAKERLKAASFGKCWYCEARQERADNAVDHYRPKSLYPWLAFALANLRYACTFCNSVRRDGVTGEVGGKGDHFPLFNDARAANSGQLSGEDRVLLDPCVGADPGLLDFLGDGSACAKHPKQAKRAARANRSVQYYHLNHSELVESRRKLALQIKEWIDGADAIYGEVDQGDPNVEHAFSKFAESICRALNERAEFSVCARRIVDGYRDRPWVEDLLQCV